MNFDVIFFRRDVGPYLCKRYRLCYVYARFLGLGITVQFFGVFNYAFDFLFLLTFKLPFDDSF